MTDAEPESVELHPAFFWTCPECGRDTFVRSMPVPQANLPPEALDSGFEGMDCFIAPNEVTCSHQDCARKYPVARHA